MQILFQLEMNQQDTETAFKHFWKGTKSGPAAKEFTERLVLGTMANLEKVDALIRKYAENWDIGRMSRVDKNVMRVALYEMLFCNDIPPVVSINEAVDIAKEFGDRNSGKFVNGMLDRARKDMERPARVPAKPKADATPG
jgi:N utilization substance protein B